MSAAAMSAACKPILARDAQSDPGAGRDVGEADEVGRNAGLEAEYPAQHRGVLQQLSLLIQSPGGVLGYPTRRW